SGRTEQWLARSAFPIESRWFGSVRVATYAPPLVTVATTTAGAAFGDSIRLESFAFAPTIVRGGEVVRLELNWRMVGAPIATRYKIFVHVLDASGNVIAQRDAEPMADLAPTTTWKVGEPIVDHHGIRLPANVPPQSLRIAVGFYDPETNERLPVRESGSLDHANGAPLPDGRLLFDGLRAQ
ncbi:MAG: hypothetical protein ABI874_08860, partial [Chloroflexota bacterium]